MSDKLNEILSSELEAMTRELTEAVKEKPLDLSLVEFYLGEITNILSRLNDDSFNGNSNT